MGRAKTPFAFQFANGHVEYFETLSDLKAFRNRCAERKPVSAQLAGSWTEMSETWAKQLAQNPDKLRAVLKDRADWVAYTDAQAAAVVPPAAPAPATKRRKTRAK